MTTNDNVPEGERWVHVRAEPKSELGLDPAPADPRREAAKREAEENLARVLREQGA